MGAAKKSKSTCVPAFSRARLPRVTGTGAPNRTNEAATDDARARPDGDDVEARLSEARKRLAALIRSPVLRGSQLGAAVTELLSLAGELLASERVSLWRFGIGGVALDCIELSAHGEQSYPTLRLLAADHPRLFHALSEERLLAAGDARADARTDELVTSYLAPHGVHALLVAPVFVHGRRASALLVEHTGAPRTWQLWEALVAGTIADLLAGALAAREQLRIEDQLKHHDLDMSAERADGAHDTGDLRSEIDALDLAAEAIRRSQDALRRLFSASPVPMLLVRGSDERVLWANESAASMLRIATDTLPGSSVSTVFAYRSELTDLLDALRRSGRDETREVQLRTLDGETFWALLSACRVTFGADDAVMIGFSDLTAQKAVEHQLRFLAQRDPLTQAYNRHHFWQLALTEMARVRRYHRPLSLAMIDVDHFKRVNDRYGHDVGDRMLKMIVDTCRESLRENDVLARYGGEELVVLFPETTIDRAQAVVERLRERIAEAELTLEDGRSVTATVSIGIAGVRQPDEGLDSLLKRADDALYAAKDHGRNRVELG